MHGWNINLENGKAIAPDEGAGWLLVKLTMGTFYWNFRVALGELGTPPSGLAVPQRCAWIRQTPCPTRASGGFKEEYFFLRNAFQSLIPCGFQRMAIISHTFAERLAFRLGLVGKC